MTTDNNSASTACERSLITGTLGFVGLHLVTTLLKSGFQVLGLGRHGPDNPLPEKFGPFELIKNVPDWPEAVQYKSSSGDFLYFECALENPEHIAREM